MSTRKPRKATTAADAQRIGRAYARGLLSDLLPGWERVWTNELPDGTVQINRGGKGVIRFRWSELRGRLAPEDYELVAALFELLAEQAWFMNVASGVTRAELASATGRELTRKVIASNRKAEAAARDESNAARCRELAAEGFNDSAIARIMAKEKRGGVESLRKKIARWRGSPAT